MKPAAAMWVAALVVFGLLAAGADAVRSPAQAQSAQQALCDRLAADPADPDKPPDVKGVVRIESADIPTAIKFCKSASASSRREKRRRSAQAPDACRAVRQSSRRRQAYGARYRRRRRVRSGAGARAARASRGS